MGKKPIWIVSVLILLAVFAFIYTQFTIFVIQPIGALPEGRTLVISRLNKMNFIDSADAVCERTMGGVSLFGRMAVLGAVSKNAKIHMRLPYSEWLYLISTGGNKYSK